ncbi:ARM repeat-containing protein [Nadsonia fulvescens var. elongata DSM 6958]|uniref:ARM repeat-containing protein n=1 Tax=Nadsonia fulvescens var. elongata DSM 6958 TaxID=857566 RepID=A0A1E3PE12_9ASCO|nr:ARM repeat-containing protein [Nadsonia fulvescens var. elongata DSM 6958]
MNTEALHQCFAATLDGNPNMRRHAELQLKEAEKTPGFINSCLDIVSEPLVSPGIKTAAAVYLKNKVLRYWNPRDEKYAAFKIDDGEKPVFRERLIPALAKAPTQIRAQLVTLLASIVGSDFPEQWPELFDVTMTLLQTNEPTSVYGGVLLLLEICKYYRWTSGESRKGLDKVVEIAFPIILSIGNSLVNETSNTAAEMMRNILKCYKCATFRDIPVALQDPSLIVSWGTLHILVIKKELPEEVMNLDADDRELHHWIKSKKWAFANLFRLYQRYGCDSSLSSKKKEYDAFAKLFLENFVPEILKTYFEQIELWVQKKVWLGQASIYNILAFLEEAIKVKSTWEIIKPYADTLVSHVIFPLLCPTENDLEIFEDEPIEYIHKRIDMFEEGYTADGAASNFLYSLVSKRRKTVFNSILQFIQTVCTNHIANTEDEALCIQKEGALRMLGIISPIVTGKKSPIVNMMEGFLVQYVFPDFVNSHGFVRARACEIINRFTDVEFTDVNNISYIYQNVLKCLEDANLPVQVEAALALQPLIAHDVVRESLSSHIPEVMQKLLILSNSIDIDSISGVMEEFVEVFSAQLSPFAVELATQLCDQLLRILRELAERQNIEAEDYDYNDNQDEDKTMAALGILNTLVTLLLALDNAPEVVLKLEEVFLPVIQIVLGNYMVDFLAESAELIEDCIYCLKRVSPTMWSMFPFIHDTFKKGEMAFITEMHPCIENYITYGGEDLKSKPEYIQGVFEIIQIIVNETESLDLSERALGARLAQNFLLALRGSVDQYVPMLIEVAVNNLENEGNKNNKFKIFLLEIIISSIYYNAHASLAFLQEKNYLEMFFTLWFSEMERFTRVTDKKLAILAIQSILILPIEQIPAAIQGNLSQLFSGMLSIFQTLPAAIKLREDQSKEFESENYDFDDAYDDDYEGSWDEDDTTGGLDEGADLDGSADYAEFLEEQSAKFQNDGYGFLDEDDEDLEEEPLVEHPVDAINAFAVFKNSFIELQQRDPARYDALTKALTSEEVNIISSTIKHADDTLAAAAAAATTTA